MTTLPLQQRSIIAIASLVLALYNNKGYTMETCADDDICGSVGDNVAVAVGGDVATEQQRRSRSVLAAHAAKFREDVSAALTVAEAELGAVGTEAQRLLAKVEQRAANRRKAVDSSTAELRRLRAALDDFMQALDA